MQTWVGYPISPSVMHSDPHNSFGSCLTDFAPLLSTLLPPCLSVKLGPQERF